MKSFVNILNRLKFLNLIRATKLEQLDPLEAQKAKHGITRIMGLLLKVYNGRCPVTAVPFCKGQSLIKTLDAQRFITGILEKLEVPKRVANQMSDALLAADYFGHRCMGLHRLPTIVTELIDGTVCATAQPDVLRNKGALALVSGNNAPGALIGNFCIDLAMQKAHEYGIGWVAARDSNCIGMASWYACRAIEGGLIGLCMSNAAPTLVPAGGVDAVLGENPIACAAGLFRGQLIVDMCMSQVPLQQIEMDFCSGQKVNLRSDTAYDGSGNIALSASDVLSAKRLRPFQPEHKGYALAGMVDILCGVMTGAQYSSQIPQRSSEEAKGKPAGLGQVFVAIKPDYFCCNFQSRLQDFIDGLHAAPRKCDWESVLVPGDKELQHMQMVDNEGGIQFNACQIKLLNDLADQLNVSRVEVAHFPSEVQGGKK